MGPVEILDLAWVGENQVLVESHSTSPSTLPTQHEEYGPIPFCCPLSRVLSDQSPWSLSLHAP